MYANITSQHMTTDYDDNSTKAINEKGEPFPSAPKRIKSDKLEIIQISNEELLIWAGSTEEIKGNENDYSEIKLHLKFSKSEVEEIFKECIKSGLLKQIKDAENHLASAAECLAELTQDKPKP